MKTILPPFGAAPLGVARLALVLGFLGLAPARSQSTDLTSDQLSQIYAELEELRMMIDGRNIDLNRGAASVFAEASKDPKAAVELYAKCVREVNYIREEKEESDYRDWEDRQKETFRDPRFVQGLIVQLRYLALTCEAAQGKDLRDLFPQILAYVDSLSQLSEHPSPQLLQGVNGSIFARAYRIEDLLQKSSEHWEMVPINVPGIYEKTVLPYLRDKNPENLMMAWDRRITQETQMARFYAALEEKGGNRDQRRDSERRSQQLQQGRAGGVVRAYDAAVFEEETLPRLLWNRMRDMALYVDAPQGVAAMLAFVKERKELPIVSDLVDDLTEVVEEISMRDSSEAPPVSSSTPAEAAPATTNSEKPPGASAANPLGFD